MPPVRGESIAALAKGRRPMIWNRICVCTLPALLLVGFSVSCSTGVGPGAGGSNGPGQSASSRPTGSVGLALSLAGGITINQISYVITGPTRASDTVDVSAATSTASFVVGGLTVGAGYTIALSATDTAGDPCASAPESFSIAFEQTTQLSVNLVCTVGDGGFVFPDSGAGSVQVGASVSTLNNPTTVCPVIASLSILPAEGVVGTMMTATAVANPVAGITYSVVNDDGGAVPGTLTGNTFTCMAPGQARLIATTTAPLANDAGDCPPQSTSAIITCEPSPQDSGTND
jgi:hypothetical protein